MKRTLQFWGYMSLLSIFSGCGNMLNSEKQATSIVLSSDFVQFSCAGGEAYVQIESNGAWSIGGAGETIMTSNNSGEGNQTITINASINETAQEIVKTLLIQGNGIERSIRVRQNPMGEASFDLTEAGSLENLMPRDGSGGELVSRVTISGPLQGDELRIIANLPNIEYADLSKCELNDVPDDSFRNMTKVKTIILPQTVKSIGEWAFAECENLGKVVMSENTVSIGKCAFTACPSLKEITLPAKLTSMGPSVFENCYKLEEITIPTGVQTIEESVFSNCKSLKKVVLHNSVKQIKREAFTLTAIETITLGNGIERIEPYAFSNCTSLNSIELPESITAIEEGVFLNCNSLKSIALGSKVAEIQKNAFSHCSSLARIDIPATVTKIGDYAFSNCTVLESLIIPEGVSEIGKHLCSDTGIKSITLPASISLIKNYAFYMCKNLKTIICGAITPPSIEQEDMTSYVFYEVADDCTVRVPAGSVDSYKNVRFWRELTITAL